MDPILSPLVAPHFATTKSAEDIAKRLREDEILINDGKACSWVAWHLPSYNTERGHAIAAHLGPLPDLSHSIRNIIYENLVNKICRHLQDDGGSMSTQEYIQKNEILSESLHPSELSIALKVLEYLQEVSVIQQDTPAKDVVSYLKDQVASPRPSTPPPQDDIFADAPGSVPKPPITHRKRLCYICRLILKSHHPSQPSMCIPCGAFNLASSQLSIPPRFSLPATFTALVTGARINLGFHTALRLLRCGARVVATSRYPRDAVKRYLAQEDSAEWKERLSVVGADFRSAADAFALVEETKRRLGAWADGGEARLHLLVNNAAQTLTDSVKKEQHAVRREILLEKDMRDTNRLIEGTYRARVRGEALPLELEDTKQPATQSEDGIEGPMAFNATNLELEPYAKSSWVQSLFDIPYEDVISAHAVNTFVPLILCRELLPLMGDEHAASHSNLPQGYIINVSSREGIFEDRRDSGAKRGKHVHTNMSKAALNMITETEAATAWQSRRVVMNTVDPGYMSAAPECEDAFDGMRPIGWEDGAGRVLWPVAVGEREGMVVWGRFLKHYGAVVVEPGAGRG